MDNARFKFGLILIAFFVFLFFWVYTCEYTHSDEYNKLEAKYDSLYKDYGLLVNKYFDTEELLNNEIKSLKEQLIKYKQCGCKHEN